MTSAVWSFGWALSLLDSGHSIPPPNPLVSYRLSSFSPLFLIYLCIRNPESPTKPQNHATEPGRTAMSGVFDSIVGGTRTPRQYDILCNVLRKPLADRFVLSRPTGANDKGEHSFKLVTPISSLSTCKSHNWLYSDAVLPSVPCWRSTRLPCGILPFEFSSSSCAHLSLSFTAPGNDQDRREVLPRMIVPTSPG